MAERLSDLGYAAVKKEATKGVAVTPNVFLPLVRETINVNAHIEDINPIVGLKSARYAAIKGQRDFTGEIELIAEPNSVGYLLDMLLTRTSTTGAGPYTHVFGLSAVTNPNSYTLDLLTGQSVFRYYGVEARELTQDFRDNKMHTTAMISALGAFTVREIAGVAGTGPYTVTLKTDYDSSPTTGLVVGDLIRFFLANGTTVDSTIVSIPTGTTFTVTANPTVAAGDYVTLRAQTTSLSFVDWFQWAKTQYKFGATSTAALSAAQTQLEKGSNWHIFHHMLPNEGAKRSGSYNPLSLIRGLGDINFNSKIFFDTPDEHNRFLASYKRAVAIQHLAGSTNQYSMQVLINNMIAENDNTDLNVNNLLWNEVNWKTVYDPTDAQQFSVTLVNNVTTY